MAIYDIVLKNRSYRRFYQEERIEHEVLLNLLELARLSASGSNKQALKFVPVSDPGKCDIVFPSAQWAGYLKNWDGPRKGEQPSAYIIILGDTTISKTFGVDHGIAAQSILLGATEKGYGGCMIASISRKKLRHDLNIPLKYEILLIIALGKPREKVLINEVKDGDIKYWRDNDDVHHVPKRSIRDIIVEL
jgi:nitroreductase